MNKPSRIMLPQQKDFRARFTTAEFVAMSATGAFDDMKVELIGGELQRMTPPNSQHGRYQMQIGIRLSAGIEEKLIAGETAIDAGDDTVVACDAAILHAAVDEDRMLRPDDIAVVIEVAKTTLAKDTGPKRGIYARAGIKLYWVVDIERRVTHVYGEPINGDYADISTVRFGQPLAIPGSDRTITLD